MTWLLGLYFRIITPREDEDKGAAMVEYGMLVAFIALIAVVGVTLFGTELKKLFDTITAAI
jgi:pilus assembly protein Flp/PilA